MNTEILGQIGLSKNEIKIYFALLDLDQTTATPLVKKTSIPNSKIYLTIDKLMKKGLASYVIKNNVRYYQASDPKNLIEFLDSKEKLILEQKDEIQKLIPQINLRRQLAGEKQESRVYEGLEGVKAAFNSILYTLNKGEEYLVFTLGEELKLKDTIRFFQNYHKLRVDKEIKVRLISNISIRKTMESVHRYPLMNIRYTTQILPTGVFIFKDHVMTLVWSDKPTAFVTTSKKNAERFKEFFEEVWSKSKKK